MCSEGETLRYVRRVSGALADRIDLYVDVARVPLEELVHGSAAESSAEVRRRVARTIADLETCDTVGDEHLLEALRYRRSADTPFASLPS